MLESKSGTDYQGDGTWAQRVEPVSDVDRTETMPITKTGMSHPPLGSEDGDNEDSDGTSSGTNSRADGR